MSNPAPILAGIGHNSGSFIEMVEADPTVIFREDDVLDGLIAETNDEIAAFEVDLSTDKGRKAVASLAAGIVRRKTAIDAAGKVMNEDLHKQINAVDAVRRRVRTELDKLRDSARAPLTEWEEAEKARASRIAETITFLRTGYAHRPLATIDHVDALVEEIKAIDAEAPDLGQHAIEIRTARDAALSTLARTRAEIVSREEERAELERLRAEKAAREQAEAAERAAEAMRQREAQIAKEAAERAAEAERAKHEAALAAERRERERLQREADEKAAAEARDRADEERRAKNRAHRLSVLTAAKAAIMAEASVDEDTARAIVKAIEAGRIPRVSVQF